MPHGYNAVSVSGRFWPLAACRTSACEGPLVTRKRMFGYDVLKGRV